VSKIWCIVSFVTVMSPPEHRPIVAMASAARMVAHRPNQYASRGLLSLDGIAVILYCAGIGNAGV
jgi:hypothetical protein